MTLGQFCFLLDWSEEVECVIRRADRLVKVAEGLNETMSMNLENNSMSLVL
jgi:hypothetical protein